MRTAQHDNADGQRIIAGRVTGAGVAVSGSGYVPYRVSTGTYLIRFTPAFRSLIAVTFSIDAPVSYEIGYLQEQTAESVKVVTYPTNTGSASDTAFAFIAVGIGSR